MSDEQPRTFRAWALGVLSSSGAKRIGVALAGFVVYAILWAQTQMAGRRAERAEDKADTAGRKVEKVDRKVEGSYEDLAPKAEATGDDVKKLREDLNVLLAERAERLKRLEDRRAARRVKAVPPKPVNPATAAPLPDAPALAPKEPTP